MVTKTPGGLAPATFDQLIDHFIEREDPHAISLDVFTEIDAYMQTETSLPKETLSFEFLGRFVRGQLELLPLLKSSLFEIKGNEICFPNGWRIVLQVEPPPSIAG